MKGFRVHTVDDGRNMPHEYLPADGLMPKMGMALRLEGGKLVAAKGAERPGYISMAERTEACKAGETIPVIRAAGDTTWETEASAVMTGIKTGDKVTISTDGLYVTATKGGAAVVLAMDGTAIGDRIVVRFGGNCEDCP